MFTTTGSSMWASSPMPPCFLRLSIFGSSTTTITKPPPERCFPLAVSPSNKFQRRPPPPQNSSGDDHAQDIRGLGLTVLTALKSNPQIEPLNPRPQNSASSIKNPISKQRSREEEQEERQLSGSDVLMALQRAAAQKIKKKRRRDYSSSKLVKNRGPSGTVQKEGEEEETDTWNYSNARPICVKSDWTTRLDEFEKRLQELVDTAIIQ
ncbi:hypothetical protein CsSME_00023668 [Camellia sinensis var. sinensis]